MCDLEINAAQASMRRSNIEWISKSHKSSVLKIEPNVPGKKLPWAKALEQKEYGAAANRKQIPRRGCEQGC